MKKRIGEAAAKRPRPSCSGRSLHDAVAAMACARRKCILARYCPIRRQALPGANGSGRLPTAFCAWAKQTGRHFRHACACLRVRFCVILTATRRWRPRRTLADVPAQRLGHASRAASAAILDRRKSSAWCRRAPAQRMAQAGQRRVEQVYQHTQQVGQKIEFMPHPLARPNVANRVEGLSFYVGPGEVV